MVEIDKGIFRPEALAKFFTSDDFARGFQENGQKQKRLFLEPDSAALSSQLASPQIYLEICETYQ
jgi:hypothetical protein